MLFSQETVKFKIPERKYWKSLEMLGDKNALTDSQRTDTFEVNCIFERGRFNPARWVQWLRRDYLMPPEEKGCVISLQAISSF